MPLDDATLAFLQKLRNDLAKQIDPDVEPREPADDEPRQEDDK